MAQELRLSLGRLRGKKKRQRGVGLGTFSSGTWRLLLCRAVCCPRRPAVLQGSPAERIAAEPFGRGARGETVPCSEPSFHSGDSVSSLLAPPCAGDALPAPCPPSARPPSSRSFTTIFSKHGPARGHLYWFGPEFTLRSSLFRACATPPPRCVCDRRVGRVLEGGLVRSATSRESQTLYCWDLLRFLFFKLLFLLLMLLLTLK